MNYLKLAPDYQCKLISKVEVQPYPCQWKWAQWRGCQELPQEVENGDSIEAKRDKQISHTNAAYTNFPSGNLYYFRFDQFLFIREILHLANTLLIYQLFIEFQTVCSHYNTVNVCSHLWRHTCFILVYLAICLWHIRTARLYRNILIGKWIFTIFR